MLPSSHLMRFPTYVSHTLCTTIVEYQLPRPVTAAATLQRFCWGAPVQASRSQERDMHGDCWGRGEVGAGDSRQHLRLHQPCNHQASASSLWGRGCRSLSQDDHSEHHLSLYSPKRTRLQGHSPLMGLPARPGEMEVHWLREGVLPGFLGVGGCGDLATNTCPAPLTNLWRILHRGW